MHQIIRKYYDTRYRMAIRKGEVGWGGDAAGKRFDGWRKTIELLRATPFFPTTGNLLELGCGNGMISLHMTAFGFNVTGIDISPTAIAWARRECTRRRGRAEFIVGDAVDMDMFSEGRFDVVLDGNCVHCVTSGVERGRLFSEVKRVLKPNGIFVVSSMCNVPPVETTDLRYHARESVVYLHDVPYRYCASVGSLLEEIRQHGFKVVDGTLLLNRTKSHIVLCTTSK